MFFLGVCIIYHFLNCVFVLCLLFGQVGWAPLLYCVFEFVHFLSVALFCCLMIDANYTIHTMC